LLTQFCIYGDMTQTAEHYAHQSATGAASGARKDAAPGARPEEDQTAVFRAVIRTFRKGGAMLDTEKRELLLRLLGRILPKVDLSARRELALALARDPRGDRGLISLILNDSIDVARPVLERSPALAARELLEIVDEKPSAFRRAIAARPGLPGEVCAALAETGDPAVIRTLLANGRARIPRSAFTAIASAARDHPELREALGKRSDLPAGIAGELSAGHAQDAEKAAAALAAKLDRAGHLRVSVLVGALRQKQTEFFEHAFALLTGLPIDDLRPLLRDRSGFPLALAARAARMDRSAFSTVFVNYCEARGVSPQMNEADLDRAMDVFRNLPQEGARAELHRLARTKRLPAPVNRFAMNPLLQT
jgi:uncharacterized protein (DUF2336 family)